jgi:hypothetical protein
VLSCWVLDGLHPYGGGGMSPPLTGEATYSYGRPGPWRGTAGPPCAIPLRALPRAGACPPPLPGWIPRFILWAALAAVSAFVIALTKAGLSWEVPDWSMSTSLLYFSRSTSATMPVRFVNRRCMNRRRMAWPRLRTASRNCLRAWWKVPLIT